MFDPDFWGATDSAELLAACSLVVGLHPDQATEPIVEYAIASGKPFAIVPCCVFSRDNPFRRLASGRSVHSYDDFCTYLCEKAGGRVERAFLKMEGKNQVLFWRGPEK